jgi:hypothetical protein
MLPWPPALEAVLPQAIDRASAERYGSGTKLSPTRRLRAILRRNGFETVRTQTTTIERIAPFDDTTLAFLEEHLAYLREFAYPHLPPDAQHLFDESTNALLPRSLQQQTDS